MQMNKERRRRHHFGGRKEVHLTLLESRRIMGEAWWLGHGVEGKSWTTVLDGKRSRLCRI
jgi:hypothetical protein